MHFAFAARMLRLGTDQCIVQSLVVALAMVMRHEFSSRFPHALSPNKIIRSKHDSLIVRTNRSACAFKLGLRGGSFTEATPASASRLRNSAVNNGSRSWIR